MINPRKEIQLYGKTLTYRTVTISKRTSQGRQNLRKPALYKNCENNREMRMLTWMMVCPPHVIIQLIYIYDLKFFRAHIFNKYPINKLNP